MTSNTISGRVVEKGTGLGIQDLLIVIFDVDPNTKPEEVILGTPAAGATPSLTIVMQPQPPGDRLGSVLTGSDGSFALSYEDAEHRYRNPEEQRPDLMLLVMAPEDASANSHPSILLGTFE